MTTESNPYAPPSTDDLDARADHDLPEDPPLGEYELVERGELRWRLCLYPSQVRLVPTDGRPTRSMTRRAFVERTALSFTLFNPVLSLRQPTLRLWLTPASTSALRAWLSPALDDHLAQALKSRRWGMIALGLVWIALSFPWGGRDRFSPIDLGMGAAFVGCAVAAAIKPHRALFLIESLLWGWFAVGPVIKVVGGASPWLLVVSALAAQVVAGSLRAYRFYDPAGEVP